jgi:hypothetical protein
MLTKPCVADLVKAGFYIPFKDPPGRLTLCQYIEALRNSVRCRSFGPEPIGIRVRLHFSHGLQSQQVKRLLGTICHDGNTERTTFAILFGDINAPQRLGSIPSTP